jgi:hypothetical protein
MNVLIGCEHSGVVREAFRALGHAAYSNDILPADDASPYHIQGDVFDAIDSQPWDLIILHPPCTYLCSSGLHWNTKRPARAALTEEAIRWTLNLWYAACARSPRVALENPIGCLSSKWRKPDQIVQPWQHGHGETKATCFWLYGLNPLTPTNIVAGREQKMWKLPPSPDRWKLRSKTYQGIAAAMASQWSLKLHLDITK